MTENTPAGYEELLAENARLKYIQPVGQRATLFVVSIVILCALTVIGVVIVQITRPDKDNTAIIATIVGVTSPILIALLGAAIQQVHLAVNSRLSQLLELTAAASKAKGVLAERDKNTASITEVHTETIKEVNEEVKELKIKDPTIVKVKK